MSRYRQTLSALAKRLEAVFLAKSSSAGVEYEILDGVRGLAVIFVLLSHLGLARMDPVPGLSFAGSGKYGVFLFFALSAFLLSAPFYASSRQHLLDPRTWWRYAKRRFWRIAPLFCVALLLSWCFGQHLFTLPLTAAELRDQLPLFGGGSLFWAIPVEVQYYLLLPLVVLMLHLLLQRRLLPATLTIGSLIGLVSLFLWPPGESLGNDLRLGPYLPIFLSGSLAALVQHRINSVETARHPGLVAAMGIGAGFILLIVLSLVPDLQARLTGHPMAEDRFHHDFVLFGLLWSTFILTALNSRGLIADLLSSPLLRLFGNLSFSLYLLHMPVVWLVHQYSGPGRLQGWLVLVVSLLLSSLTYVLIERPFFTPGRPWPLHRFRFI